MSDASQKFGTTINCMDGRAVLATILWMKDAYGLDYVDTIGEPGMDAYIQNMNEVERKWLKRKIEISIKNHGSRTISLVGHEDCAGNPVTKAEHLSDIAKGVVEVKKIVGEIDPTLNVETVGLWSQATPNQVGWSIERID